MFIFDTPYRSDRAGLFRRSKLYGDMHRLAGQGFGNRYLVVKAAQVAVHHHFQGLACSRATGDDVFTVHSNQSSTALGAGTDVLDLPGFLKRFARQHDGLVGRGDVGVKHHNVAKIMQADGSVGGCH